MARDTALLPGEGVDLGPLMPVPVLPVAMDGKWGPWNAWSLCSKTCDTGWQRRFRMCQASGAQGYPCEGTGEEVKPCSEKRCPGTACMLAPGPRRHGGGVGSGWGAAEPCLAPAAFHEMCRDEYVMLMTWKKAAAGEIIYNKCPPNASGKGWGGSPCRTPP